MRPRRWTSASSQFAPLCEVSRRQRALAASGRGARAEGHDAVHLRERGLQAAADEDVFALAASEHRVLVSEDADFGTLLAMREAPRPSVILFRHMPDRRAAALLAILLANLAAVETDLVAGALVVIEPTRLRVRTLPMRGLY